jgi:hypothetical protein
MMEYTLAADPFSILTVKISFFRDLLHRHGDSFCFRDGARGTRYGDDVVSSSCAGYEDSGTTYSAPAPTATCDQATTQSNEGQYQAEYCPPRTAASRNYKEE